MKIPLWFLVVLLACLFTPGHSDCQGECVACGVLLQQQQMQQAFNTMVCLLECEGHVSSSLTWEVCKRAVKLSQHPALPEGGAVFRRTGEELQLTSLDLDSDSERFQDEDQTLEQRSVRYDSSQDGEDEGRQPREELGGDEDDGSEGLSLSKRFGGFQRGRHGYRKLIGSPVRPLQKRYGGFIGVRKSARKWNSQKRVNQLLRQYLGMRSSRSGRFNNNPVTRVWRQNKL
ncbi:prepronociceptin b [Amphiprion ocellaris]|uniref:Prepronociceptin b n=1 Tax=Amphiprion ocellaris TaxID=80972 RepID=A0A3Q1BBI5_AMPOC|nr:prepronociceptin b [Amphiprion ocellaris]